MGLILFAAAAALLGSPHDPPLPALAVVPERVVINDTAAVELTAAVGDARDALFVVEAGRIEPLPSNETGQARARWHLPSELTPRRLAAAVLDRRTGAAGFALLAISRRARLRVTATPHALLRLRLAGTLVAQGRADAFGKLDLGLVVPPAVDLAQVEQELAGRSDAARKLAELDVRNELHVFGVAPEDPLLPDGTATTSTWWFAYRDDGRLGAGAVVLASAATGELRAADAGAGRYQAAVRAGPWRQGAPPSHLVLDAVAKSGGDEARSALKIALGRLPPREVALSLPPMPWEAGSVYEVGATVTDAAGRVMPELEVTAAVADDAGGEPFTIAATGVTSAGEHRIVLRTPKRIARPEHELTVRVAPDGPAARATVRLAPGPPAALVFSAPRALRGKVQLDLSVRDRFGNPTTAPPYVEASAGTVSPPEAGDAGEYVVTWQPSSPRQSSRAVVRAGVQGTEARAETVVAYTAPVPGPGIGLYVGFGADGAYVAAPSAVLVATYPLRALHEDLGLLAALGATSEQRAETADVPAAGARVERSLLLAPVTVGVEWRWLLASRVTARAAAGTGAVVAATSTRAKVGDTELAPARRVIGAAWIWRAGARLGFGLGPGEASLLVEVWDALTSARTLARRPRAATVALGYSFELQP